MEVTENSLAVTLTVGQMHDLIRECIREELRSVQPTKEGTDNYLTRVEACEKLHISLPTLSKYLGLGIVRGSKVGNRILIPIENINNALQDLSTRKNNK
jgi:hypothetical protein